jgi:hypothetical protein
MENGCWTAELLGPKQAVRYVREKIPISLQQKISITAAFLQYYFIVSMKINIVGRFLFLISRSLMQMRMTRLIRQSHYAAYTAFRLKYVSAPCFCFPHDFEICLYICYVSRSIVSHGLKINSMLPS